MTLGQVTVGVLALQGAFVRHVETLRRCGVHAIEVRTPAQLDTVDALVLPGGESTTMSKLLVANELEDPLAVDDVDRVDPGHHWGEGSTRPRRKSR